ncbi:hypothetical protein J7E79_02940 [Bacillus sp. ISL-40]|uniref:hypothetical protein n=1 Tax=unclassified Bacillus (in: firmicutes) TaxID=185979 RepID=UPI001BEC7177|nr:MULTISPECIES: hypothetical protein [unclassified Bacillus (in: firmicutes)]MBT2696393.1 hypothetical protein [Bacillus sp. ISL-40]MBT2741591.1 hypothetical protein [Bacillus sp. ISL-77]
MKKTKEDFMQYVTMFDEEDKEFFLEGAEIDEGIKNVVDAINEIDDFVTMNSCQGGGHRANGIIELIVPSQPQDVKDFVKELMKDYDVNHCPITYVDFYVLNNNYILAHELFIFLQRKFPDVLQCTLEFQYDFIVNDDDEAIPTGEVDYRYGIKSTIGYDKELLDDLSKTIRYFKTLIVNEKE